MNRTEKAQAVQSMAESFGQAPHVFVTGYRGMSVNQSSELRRRVRAAGGTYQVVKNRLARRAAADTAVAVGRRILGKPEEGDRATDTLERLRGRNHRVYSAICLITPDDRKRERVVETRVRFRNFSDEEITNYIASGEWKGKAGGYAIQGIAGGFVVKLVGSYTNVVGLPLTEVVTLLQGEGYKVNEFWPNLAEIETE